MSKTEDRTAQGAFDLRRRARLRSDAPHVRGVEPGRWYDIDGGDPTAAGADGAVLLRPADALPGDREAYIPLPLSMVELRDAHGRRRVRDGTGEWWTAERRADGRVLFVSGSGAYRLVMAPVPLDDASDDALRDWLERGEPSHPGGLRVEAKLRATHAWSYRMLNAEAWYLVDQSRTSESAVAIVTIDGCRIVDAGHVEVRSFLD